MFRSLCETQRCGPPDRCPTCHCNFSGFFLGSVGKQVEDGSRQTTQGMGLKKLCLSRTGQRHIAKEKGRVLLTDQAFCFLCGRPHCAADHILWQMEIHHLPEIHSKEEALQWPSTVTLWLCKPIVFPTVSKDSVLYSIPYSTCPG